MLEQQITILTQLLTAVDNDQFTVGEGYMKAGEWCSNAYVTIPNEEELQEVFFCLDVIGPQSNIKVSVPDYLELVRKEMHEAIKVSLFFAYCIHDNGELNEVADHFPNLVKDCY